MTYAQEVQIALTIIMVICTILSGVGTIVATSIKVTNAINAHEQNMVQLINNHELLDTRRFAEINASIGESNRHTDHNIGEQGLALREQLHKLALEISDGKTVALNTFMRREGFYAVQTQMTQTIDALAKRVDAVLEQRKHA